MWQHPPTTASQVIQTWRQNTFFHLLVFFHLMSRALQTQGPLKILKAVVLLLPPGSLTSCCHCQSHRNFPHPPSRRCWSCTPGRSPCRSRSWSRPCSCADPRRAPGSPVWPWPSAARSGAWWTARSCSWGHRSPPTSPPHVSEGRTERLSMISIIKNVFYLVLGLLLEHTSRCMKDRVVALSKNTFSRKPC